VQRLEHDEFGRVLFDSNPGLQPFGFAGGLVDEDTGLVRFGARDYEPVTGRWTARDPVRFVAGENSYAYASSAPADSIDPAGLAGQPTCDQLMTNAAVRCGQVVVCRMINVRKTGEYRCLVLYAECAQAVDNWQSQCGGGENETASSDPDGGDADMCHG